MEDILSQVRELDKKFNWNTYDAANTREEKLALLTDLLVNLMGEIGEFANEVKKAKRDGTFNEGHLKEELTDTFIFALKLALTLNMDIKTEITRKLAKNEQRFAHFARRSP